MGKSSPKLLYVVGNDQYFCSHRLPLAVAARKTGYDVYVATVVTTMGPVMKKAGLKVIPLQHLRRGRANPFKNLLALWEIWSVMRKIKPDITHDVAMKPVLFGAIAAYFTRVPRRIHALGGLGFLFISQSIRTKLIRSVVVALWKFFLRGNHQTLILQNTADRDVFISNHILHESSIALIAGSGVDLEVFKPIPHVNKVPLLVCAARMLWDKGIGELVESARQLKQQGMSFELWLCGGLDLENPAHIPEAQLRAWQNEGIAQWLGHCESMAEIYGKADVAVLPSYREGMPKSLQEAAACGLPIVTTDVPGCREIVPRGTNGILVPSHEVEPLAAALKFYLLNPDRRKSHGMNSRGIAEKYFSHRQVVEQTLKLYETVIIP